MYLSICLPFKFFLKKHLCCNVYVQELKRELQCYRLQLQVADLQHHINHMTYLVSLQDQENKHTRKYEPEQNALFYVQTLLQLNTKFSFLNFSIWLKLKARCGERRKQNRPIFRAVRFLVAVVRGTSAFKRSNAINADSNIVWSCDFVKIFICINIT